MSDDPRLNSLERFRKRPGRLVLEVYGNCEVPAGCGGAVLRWRNPRAAVPARIYLYTPVDAACSLDGAELRTAGADLTPGPHVLTVALAPVGGATALLMFAAISDDRGDHRPPQEGAGEPRLAIRSTADGTWRYSLTPPPEVWRTLTFDDAAWPALVGVQTPGLDYGDHGGYQCRRAREAGAACLGLAEPAPGGGSVWVRKVFQVPAPEGA